MYVGNVAAFLKHLLDHSQPGYRLYNYVDQPDFTMNELVSLVLNQLSVNSCQSSVGENADRGRSVQLSGLIWIPYWVGMLGGYGFDALAKLSGRKLPISSVRVKKFCATTQFAAKKLQETGFVPPFTLDEGLRRTLAAEFGNSG